MGGEFYFWRIKKTGTGDVWNTCVPLRLHIPFARLPTAPFLPPSIGVARADCC